MDPSLPTAEFPDTIDAAAARVADWLRLLVAPGSVVELVALAARPNGRGKPHTQGGFFDSDHLDAMARIALEIGGHGGSVYWTLNPLHPDLMARRSNRIERARTGDLAGDSHVVSRRRLMIDVDPVRDGKISATDAEKLRAWETAALIRAFLEACGWPAPVVLDSGNGFNLLYLIELPAADVGLVKRVLEKLAKRFDSDGAKVDRAVHNPARLCKVPGTWARKGDSTADRPHRRSALLDGPASAADLGVVTREQLEGLPDPPQRVVDADADADVHPPPPPRGGERSGGGAFGRLRMGDWLADRGVEFRVKAEPDSKGRTVYVLGACPFNPAHRDPDSCVMQDAAGKLSAICLHNSCRGLGWKAFKGAIGKPDRHHYDEGARPVFRPPPQAEGGGGGCSGPPGEDPSGERDTRPPERPVVLIDGALFVAETMAMITSRLVEAGDCFRRAGQLVRISGAEIAAVLTPPELGGLLNQYAEVLVAGKNGTEYKPLPTNYAGIWLNNSAARSRLPPLHLFTLNPVYTVDWRIAPSGYDSATGIYYAGPSVEPRPRPERLTALLADFCFRTAADRTNYVAVLLTAVLMPRFIGSHPAALFTANQPGLGKSVLAQIVSILRDGRPAETVSYNPNDEEFEKRLGAAVRSGATTIIVDNAKGRGRAPCIESACLERSITDPVLSYRLLGQSDRIRAENSHIFCITANSPQVGRDLVTRSILVALHHEGNPTRRSFAIDDPEGYALDHRLEILGELLGMVEAWLAAGSPRSDAKSRFDKKGWGPIVGGILAVGGFEDFMGNAEAAASELDETRRQFGELVTLMADRPESFWTPAELAGLALENGLFPDHLTSDSPRSQSTQVGVLASRYVGERFTLGDGCSAVFSRAKGDKGNVYRLDALTPPPSGVRAE